MPEFTRVGIARTRYLTFEFEGTEVPAAPGETVAAALLCAGVTAFRVTGSQGARAPVCNMGVCFECVLVIDGHALVRSCMTPAREGMKITREVDA